LANNKFHYSPKVGIKSPLWRTIRIIGWAKIRVIC
jgi:hypothetical protein